MFYVLQNYGGRGGGGPFLVTMDTALFCHFVITVQASEIKTISK